MDDEPGVPLSARSSSECEEKTCPRRTRDARSTCNFRATRATRELGEFRLLSLRLYSRFLNVW
jgi:hypothetical protein